MKIVNAFSAAFFATATTAALAGVQIGESAPAFSLTDVNGKAVSLADFKGKHVVLEWTNPNCPFVRKHYESKNMQGLQSAYTSKGVVWLAINSTSEASVDYMQPSALNTKLVSGWGAKPSATLMDADGTVGKRYGARTTPHMYVIDPQGKLIYAGGIDDKRSSNPADVATAKNYVRTALDEALAGKAVSTPTATPYGCGVKYN